MLHIYKMKDTTKPKKGPNNHELQCIVLIAPDFLLGLDDEAAGDVCVVVGDVVVGTVVEDGPAEI